VELTGCSDQSIEVIIRKIVILINNIRLDTRNSIKKREKEMKNDSKKPGTLTAPLYITGLIISGYFVIKTIVS
jgi:hypothetical protein